MLGTRRKTFFNGSLALFVLLGGCGLSTISAEERAAYTERATVVSGTPRGGTLGPDDVFEVRVYNEPTLSGIFRVSPNGTVDFPLVGSVTVEGKRQEEVAALLGGRLQAGFIREPFVTVYIKEYNSKKIFVMGMVEKPGTFVFQDGMNIVQAITLAGGFSTTAVKNETIVTRVHNGSEQRIPVPVDEISAGRAKNFRLFPGDIVFVPESVL
jgi:protein involved in polysaccharide export with SLBB domain